MNTRAVAVVFAVLAVTASAVSARDLLSDPAPMTTPKATVKVTPSPTPSASGIYIMCTMREQQADLANVGGFKGA